MEKLGERIEGLNDTITKLTTLIDERLYNKRK
jgi:hypothetical protein